MEGGKCGLPWAHYINQLLTMEEKGLEGGHTELWEKG